MDTKSSLTSKEILIVLALSDWVFLVAQMVSGQFRVYVENQTMRNFLIAFVAIQLIGLTGALLLKRRFWSTALVILAGLPLLFMPVLQPALATIFVGHQNRLEPKRLD